MSRIQFEIVPPIRRPEETVFMCGSLPVLGEWDPSRALALQWDGTHHRGEIHVETGVHFEYKILRGPWTTEAVDAHGNVPPNFVHETWLDSTRHHTVADWKDRIAGRLTMEEFPSAALAGSRKLLIWLPPGYATEPERRFPVIVLHDGANVFDPATSFSGVDWAADEWVVALHSEGVLSEAIVVGVCHPEDFSEENETLRDFDLSPELGGDAYAKFLVSELIPHLDSHYRTLPVPEARFLGGASLGGLMTFYTALHHPGTFSRFACLSTAFEDVSSHLPQDAPMLRELGRRESFPPGTRLYFDYGTHGLDECYAPYHQDLASLLQSRAQPGLWTVRCIENGGHSELSWRARFGEALRFLAEPFRQSSK